jgi:malate dehydrogenase
VVECAYVATKLIHDVPYLANPLVLGPEGIQKNLGLGIMSAYEKQLLAEALPAIKASIQMGLEFVNK